VSAPRVVNLVRPETGKIAAKLRGSRSMTFERWLDARKMAKALWRDGAKPEHIAIATGLSLVGGKK